MAAPPLKLFNSPCTSVCRIDPHTGWCEGCQRTIAEIKAWKTASETERRAILDRLPARKVEKACITDL
ncbi:conserved hypothetical protein [Candidatus Terasakiella magnetica]|nr:conserved hypothetical protein [Candidatus Terasakiella magnetica]